MNTSQGDLSLQQVERDVHRYARVGRHCGGLSVSRHEAADICSERNRNVDENDFIDERGGAKRQEMTE